MKRISLQIQNKKSPCSPRRASNKETLLGAYLVNINDTFHFIFIGEILYKSHLIDCSRFIVKICQHS